jgi:hypothetical protein
MARVILDSFSGPASELRGSARTSDNVLAVLSRNPRVSCWDMSEHAWLRSCISDLVKRGAIAEDKSEPYPFHKFTPTPEAADE